MLLPWNRKELAVTFSMQEQARIRDALSAKGIDYMVKAVNRNSPSAFSDTRAQTGTLGQKMDIAYEYIIFVHKKDLAGAKALLGGNIR